VGKPAIWRGEVPDCLLQTLSFGVRSRGPLPEYLHLHFLADARLGRFAALAKVSASTISVPIACHPGRLRCPQVTNTSHHLKFAGLQARNRHTREALEAVRPLLDQLRNRVLAAAFRWRPQQEKEWESEASGGRAGNRASRAPP